MERNLKKERNNIFAKFTCSICLDIFDAEEHIYESTYNQEVVCYNCVRQTEKRIIKRIDEKIEYLQRQKEILLK